MKKRRCMFKDGDRCKATGLNAVNCHSCDEFEEEINVSEGVGFGSETEGYSDIVSHETEDAMSSKEADVDKKVKSKKVRKGVVLPNATPEQKGEGRLMEHDHNADDLQFIKDLMDGAEKVIIYRKSGLKATLEFNQNKEE
jgi:hypothetical protein